MKRLPLLALCLIFVLSGCFEEQNLSVYGNTESDGVFGIRAGTEVAQNLEVGASANYVNGESTTTETWRFEKKPCRLVRTTHEETEDDWRWGLHGIYRIPMDGITPYVGAQVNIGEGSEDVIDTLEPLGGINLDISETVSLFSEYQRQSLHGEDNKVLFGVRFRF